MMILTIENAECNSGAKLRSESYHTLLNSGLKLKQVTNWFGGARIWIEGTWKCKMKRELMRFKELERMIRRMWK
jgi:hypothetical protein